MSSQKKSNFLGSLQDIHSFSKLTIEQQYSQSLLLEHHDVI